MKLEIKLIPSDMNEAQSILKALGGFTIGGTQKVTETVETDTTPSQVESLAEAPAPQPDAPAPAPQPEALPELKDLTLGTERDSDGRLWCKEINTANKGKKGDGTFKRAPKLDDGYFNHVINLLEQEAVTQEPEAPAPVPEAPAPVPEAPAPKLVAYMYQGQRYTPEQLAGWSAEQIAANCEAVYEEAPAGDEISLESQILPLVTDLVGSEGFALQTQRLCGLLSGKEKAIPQEVPMEKRGQLLKALETMKANKVAIKDGSMTVDQLV